MMVVIASELPPAVRGRMKLWFIEIKPNVFVSGVKESVAKQVVDYLYNSCSEESGLLIMESLRKAPYYKIIKKGFSLDYIGNINGLPLVFDRNSVGQ